MFGRCSGVVRITRRLGRALEDELLHVPRGGWTPLRAEAAVDADVLVLDHESAGLRQRTRSEDSLLQIGRGGRELLPELRLGHARGREREARERADIDACVTLDAQPVCEHGLDIAVEAPLDLTRRLLRREAELHLGAERLEPLLELDVAHLLSAHGVVVVLVGPFVEPHLRAAEVHPDGRPLGDGDLVAVVVDGNRSLMGVLDGPDDVFRSPRCVPPEEDSFARRLERLPVDLGITPLVELEADVLLDPGERTLLAYREDDGVGRDEDGLERDALVGLTLVVELPLDPVEVHSLEDALLDHEVLGGVVDDDLDLLFLGVVELPWRSLEESARLARHDLHALAAEAS